MSDVVLPVRRRLLLVADGNMLSSDCAFCPARRHSVRIEVCRECADAHTVSSDLVVCAARDATLGIGLDAPAATAAASRVTLVRASVPARVLLDACEPAPGRTAVVDSDGRFLGFVAFDRLEDASELSNRVACMEASDLATDPTLCILEGETLGRALRLMARRGARWLALVDEAGVVQGVISDLDAMRALRHR